MSGAIVLEAQCYLQALCLGFGLMLAYELLRVFREIVTHSAMMVGLEDFLYWMCSALSIFGLLYNYNYGVIRWFIILGVFMGMVLCQMTIGKIRKKVTKLLKKQLKNKHKRSRMLSTEVLCRERENCEETEQSCKKEKKKTTSE